MLSQTEEFTCCIEDQYRYTDFTGYRIVFWDYTIWIQTLAFSLIGKVYQSVLKSL